MLTDESWKHFVTIRKHDELPKTKKNKKHTLETKNQKIKKKSHLSNTQN